LADQFNVQVNAVAGSGKTTTILHFASLTSKRVLALLYNTRLKIETRQKSDILKLSNLDIHSFHSFAYNYYGAKDANTDKGLVRVVHENLEPVSEFVYDYIICDEVQDMTPDIYALVCKIMKDNKKIFSLALLGDELQNLYQFKLADSRFLTLSDKIFDKINDKPWKKLSLSVNYRCSGNIINFLNKNMFPIPFMKATKDPGSKVTYIRGDMHKNNILINYLGKKLTRLLSSNKLSPEDIFILAPSLKDGKADNQTPINKLANYLQNNGSFSSTSPLPLILTLNKL